MEACFITTYRCNAKCDMCHIWQLTSRKSEEISYELLEKLPNNLDKVNISGGEPALREDLVEIASILVKKARKVDISTNGFFTNRLVELGKKFPNIQFRISVEGFPELNDRLRGIKNGFDRALKTIIRLKEAGVKNVGFGIVITDKNARDLLDLYKLCVYMGIELGSSTLHNSFYFNKYDNEIEDPELVINQLKKFIISLLSSKRKNIKLRIKDWGRAFINYGILKHIEGKARVIPCGAGTEFFFLDPYGNILACNGSDEPMIMGNLKFQSFEDIWKSKKADCIRELVRKCDKNCWMVGSARPAMRSHLWVPLFWIIKNKIKIMLNKSVCFD